MEILVESQSSKFSWLGSDMMIAKTAPVRLLLLFTRVNVCVQIWRPHRLLLILLAPLLQQVHKFKQTFLARRDGAYHQSAGT